MRIVDIQALVASHYGLDLLWMTSPKRSKKYARPRQIAMYISKKLTDKSYSEIAQFFNKKDHTTVLHAVRNIEKLSKQDEEMEKEVKYLTDICTGTIRKTYFVVLPGTGGKETYCKYYGELPISIRNQIIWACRLDILSDKKYMDYTLDELYQMYVNFKELDSLPEPNITKLDFAGLY